MIARPLVSFKPDWTLGDAPTADWLIDIPGSSASNWLHDEGTAIPLPELAADHYTRPQCR